MNMRMRMQNAPVSMGVRVVSTSCPPNEEPQSQEDDHQAYSQLRALEECLGQMPGVQHYWQSKGDQGGSMTQAPRQTQQAGTLGSVIPVGQHQRGYGSEVIRVGGVAKAQQQRNGKSDNSAVARPCDVLI